MQKDNLMRHVGFVAPVGLVARIHLAAEKEAMTISEFLRHAVRLQLRKTDREQKAA